MAWKITQITSCASLVAFLFALPFGWNLSTFLFLWLFTCRRFLFLPLSGPFMPTPGFDVGRVVGARSAVGRSGSICADPFFPVSGFIWNYGADLSSRRFTAMCMNDDRMSIRDVRFQRTRDNVAGGRQKWSWNWVGSGASTCCCAWYWHFFRAMFWRSELREGAWAACCNLWATTKCTGTGRALWCLASRKRYHVNEIGQAWILEGSLFDPVCSLIAVKKSNEVDWTGLTPQDTWLPYQWKPGKVFDLTESVDEIV